MLGRIKGYFICECYSGYCAILKYCSLSLGAWVTERIQSPIQNLESIENDKENEKKNRTFCRKSFKDSKTIFAFILA